MAKRTGKVWSASVGWIAKKTTEAVNYEEFQDEGWAFLISFMRWFPDFALDLLRSDQADYQNEELIQRVMMRVMAEYQYVDITGCRGLTKTNTTFKEEYVESLVWPGTKVAYYGPSYKQLAKIASKTHAQIEHDYPGLAKHYIVEAESTDRFELSTAYHSSFAITAIRGDNIHKVIAEEYAQEENPAFDYEEYKRVVLPAVRLQHMVNGKPDPTYIRFKQHSITSAGRKQNHSYDTRSRHYQMMQRGESAFVMDVPFSVPLLSQMRPTQWAQNLKTELTPEEWAREMESRYTGADANPIVSDEDLHESRSLMLMEEHHCCKDQGCKLSPEDVIYIVGYDVSYEDNKRNAKCACVVVKLTKQNDFLKRDKYLKQVVYVDDWPPPPTSMMQAKRLKQIWYKYCIEGGNATYIAIDGWQYGKSVVENLMMDLGDGLAPLCTVNHEQYTELELDGALPVIYAVKAGGAGATDPDSEMLRNAELQFANHNVQLLTSNRYEGVEAYKKAHRIKDDYLDATIDTPYKKTTQLMGQIQNLKKVPSGAGFSEKRISKHIQRDSWSALKYALRIAQRLEWKNLMKAERKSDWDVELAKYRGKDRIRAIKPSSTFGGRITETRKGGRIT